ncbi:senescence-induced receptor-like serine/threonine-protein kinase [Prunus yedoensis var. nudiflora]|uniref:Senescence-induced receptor-like serine/threonine-protein kinase n=1 Tax=Prunus yedoensis var. nudiflora TaxID=2094558 RepID=A0A314XK42_PRUYE|nr:senescence-induced receptor-like serine/threonine-protein kinase [Prunus yedoensis var. nudiflora]
MRLPTNHPSIVMSSAAAPKIYDYYLDIWWISPDENTQYQVYMHFAEVEKLPTNQSRLLSITWNGKPFVTKPFSLKYLTTTTVYTKEALSGGQQNFSISQVGNSTLPPIINAFEIYTVLELLQPETNQEDVEHITNTKSTYRVKRNWQGDPCAPKEYSWEGLNCSFDGYEPPRIISLNLSSSGLTGEIAPSLFNLTMLQTL